MAEETTGVVAKEVSGDTVEPSSRVVPPDADDMVHAEGTPAPDQPESTHEGPLPSEDAAPQEGTEEDSNQAGGGEAEMRVQELEAEVNQLRAALEEREQDLAGLREQISSATSRYRAAILAGAPEVPEELVQGQTVDELDTSLASARGIVERIAQQLESQGLSGRVPTGAPPRRAPDLGALSSQEKILFGLQRG